MERTFFERYEAVFNRVCAFLGEGWRIDRRTEDSYRIYLINPALRNYVVSARLEKHKIHLFGFVQKSRRSNSYGACMVSPMRAPWGIAEDIKNKILVNAQENIAHFEAERAGELAIQEERRLIVHLLSRILDANKYTGYYGGLCYIGTDAGLSGKVDEVYSGAYRLTIGDLDKTQLIKLAGFLSTLER